MEATIMLYGRIILMGTLVVAALVPNTGCLRRKETITVNPDQSVRIEVEYEQDTDAGVDVDKDRPTMNTKDAMPAEQSGWAASTAFRKDDNKTVTTLSASQTFGPGAALPRSFAPAGSENAELALQFPTDLTVEQRDGGTVYTLRRVYTARPWAYVQYWEDLVLEGDTKKLLDKPADELTDEERERVLRALSSIEVLRRLELSRTALEHAEIKFPSEGWLEARQALLNRIEEVDFAPMLELHKQVESSTDDSPEKEGLEKRLQTMLNELNDAAMSGYDEQLRSALGGAQFAAYERSLNHASLGYEISKETGGHAFEIRVKMPGRVIGHNGKKVEDDGTVVWEFDGKAFRDRDHELLVVSRLQTPGTETNR
jgi:hypothetical protein